MRRRDFLAGSLVFLLDGGLFAKYNNFSDLNDDEKRKKIMEIADELNGKYTFPVPIASKTARREALGVNKTSCEFGAWRKYQKHKGIDIYGFGKGVVYFADGEIMIAGRNINNFDHGNIVVVNHGEINGYELSSYYLHIGGINGIRKGDKVKMGDAFARVDCTGISPDNKRLYKSGLGNCKRYAHLHFQIRIGNMYVNPNYFFPEYSRDSLDELKRWRLALKANSIEDSVEEFKKGESLGSFSF